MQRAVCPVALCAGVLAWCMLPPTPYHQHCTGTSTFRMFSSVFRLKQTAAATILYALVQYNAHLHQSSFSYIEQLMLLQ